ncbi:MAG: hypothetical protein BMS9Abin19_1010 [Gammaproteobacteria bacterium]|nr:MAG: hypothetical protein BMS9Abin19_1010 [Gammaproteobacteria bacterium]
MTTKRALIVDDSKSARFVLKRMLKELNLEVDTVESATDAIKYLEQHQPDIIFMDHMMPGMDGFEAVKHIKNNSETALIPIMMYTSKGGDVYMSQARALGAVGIIRKTIAAVELRESLLELGLIDDIPVRSSIRIDNLETDKSAINTNIIDTLQELSATKAKALDLYIHDLHKLMDDQTIELHRSMWLGIESVGNEIFNRLNSEFEEKIDKIHATLEENNARQSPLYASKSFWPFFIVSLLLLISLSYNFALINTDNNTDDQFADTGGQQNIPPQQSQRIEQAQSPAKDSDNHQAAREAFSKWASDIVIQYPYDEVALNNRRQPFVEELIKKAQQAKYKGHIILQTHAGEFCLSSDQTGNYKLADKNTSISDCDIIGNNIQINDEPTSHQSLSFFNYFSDNEKLNNQGILVEVKSLSRKIAISDYPKRTPQTTAEAWNLAAQLNNRITVKLIPETKD